MDFCEKVQKSNSLLPVWNITIVLYVLKENMNLWN